MQTIRFILMALFTATGLICILTCTARTADQPTNALELKASSDAMFEVKDAQFTELAPNKLLVTVGDTLYLLDSHHHIVWKQIVGDVVGQPVAMTDGSIHVFLAQDKVHLVISAATGKTLSCIDCNTTARTSFTQVLPYKQNEFIVAETDAFFRRQPGSENTPDEVALWHGDKVLWTAPIPPDADVRIVGDKIFALEKKQQAIVLHQVVPAKIITPQL